MENVTLALPGQNAASVRATQVGATADTPFECQVQRGVRGVRKFERLNATGALIQKTTTEARQWTLFITSGLDVHKTTSYCVKITLPGNLLTLNRTDDPFWA